MGVGTIDGDCDGKKLGKLLIKTIDGVIEGK